MPLSLPPPVCVCVYVCVWERERERERERETLCVCGVAFDFTKVNTFKRRDGDLQIEHKKKTKQKQTDSLIFKSEFQESQGKAITWNWLNSYQQFLNSNKNVYREVKKEKKQILLNEVPESKACSTTCQPWLYFESHIWFLSPRTLSLIHVKADWRKQSRKRENMRSGTKQRSRMGERVRERERERERERAWAHSPQSCEKTTSVLWRNL